ncbi:hypothetical protein PTQ19_10175 [Microbacterium esteraromaticum]|uniref:hypothetical protein n=1 Tax=Microbacterium esteraromaticum TaxID=57043 RepID=UPI0023685F53|nr:hypothetical protein [Microbacterium esteraromaticum]WDH77887.1 hypothetical protein PTQ19_10175 [Microbacterium esteraromaticum]
MTEFIRSDALSALGLEEERPLPITRSFIEVANDAVRRNPQDNVANAVAEGAIVAIASLEMKLGKLMDAIGAREITLSPGVNETQD